MEALWPTVVPGGKKNGNAGSGDGQNGGGMGNKKQMEEAAEQAKQTETLIRQMLDQIKQLEEKVNGAQATGKDVATNCAANRRLCDSPVCIHNHPHAMHTPTLFQFYREMMARDCPDTCRDFFAQQGSEDSEAYYSDEDYESEDYSDE